MACLQPQRFARNNLTRCNRCTAGFLGRPANSLPKQRSTRPLPAAHAFVGAAGVVAEGPAFARREPETAHGTNPDVSPAHGTAGASFVWTRHWWPLLPDTYLRPDRPTPVTLLGIPMVVWLDGTGSWRVFKDRCPHRLAPLSEGRVEEDGMLSCSYHGWRFSGSGACSRIPQAVSPAAEAAACSSRRSCVTTYPARVEFGMLWVWPDGASDAASEAAAAPIVISNDMRRHCEEAEAEATRQAGSKSTTHSSVNWFMRELPYSYEVLIENLTDPAHLPFSHHGLTPPLQRSRGGPMPMQPASAPAPAEAVAAPPEQTAAAGQQLNAGNGAQDARLHWARPTGPDFEYNFAGNISRDATISLTMPHNVMYTYRFGQASMQTELFATPVGPGRSRFFTYSFASRRSQPRLGLGFQRALRQLMFMLDPTGHHVFMNKLLDGDSVFLHVQDEVVQELETEEERKGEVPGQQRHGSESNDATAASGAGKGAAGSFWSRAYYLPTPSDTAMLAARKWVDERAGGGPFRARQQQLLASSRAVRPEVPGEAPSPESRRTMLLNRYDQHTRHCPICRTRLESLERLTAIMKVVQVACLLGICIAAGGLGALAAVQGVAAAVAVAWPGLLAAGCGALGAMAVWVARWAECTAQLYRFTDYVHAEQR